MTNLPFVKNRFLAFYCSVLLFFPFLCGGVGLAEEPKTTESPAITAIDARAKELITLITESPVLIAAPIDDRAAWSCLTEAPDATTAIKRAEKMQATPIMDLPESLYREFYETGNRNHYQQAYSANQNRLDQLVIGEIIENHGRFLPALEEAVLAFCNMPSWLYPAHDTNAENYEGKTVYSDLFSTGLGWRLSLIHVILKEKLTPETDQLIVDNVRRRILEPYRANVLAEKRRMWWISAENNWNAVCHAGTLGAALCVCDSREELAWFLAATEYFSRDFINGFSPDGYCSEGLGYWNYGFGHYVFLAIMIARATDGQLDFLADPRIKSIAAFAPKMQLGPALYAAFADCSVSAKPTPWVTCWLNKKLSLGFDSYNTPGCWKNNGTAGLLVDTTAFFDADYRTIEPVENKTDFLPLRTEFPDAGIVICRPCSDDSHTTLALALKAGHNEELHNHNDVGSYTVARIASDDNGVRHADLTVCDPGGEIYTRRTFSPKRYEGELLNSFGHSVPRINGNLQKNGKQYKGEILTRSFSDDEDQIEMEISAAYDLPELESLRRLFVYKRNTESPKNLSEQSRGSLEITDTAVFVAEQPGTLESAFITRLDVNIAKQEPGQPIEVYVGGREGVCLLITGESEGNTVDLAVETVTVGENDDSVSSKPTRIAVRNTIPAQKVSIHCTIFP